MTRFVNHKFTEEELKDYSKALARATVNLRNKETEKAAVTSQLAADIKKYEGEAEGLATKVNTGSELRNMKCKVVYYWKKSVKEIVHPETGEIISTEAISLDERQTTLDGLQAKKEEKKQ